MTIRNPFIWHELVTPDQKKSGDFFSELLGWSIKQVDAGKFGTYTLFQKEGLDVAGMMNPTSDTSGQGAFWHSYIAVDDIDDCVYKTTELGGRVLVPVQEVPDVGRICVVADPTGAVAHLIQTIQKG